MSNEDSSAKILTLVPRSRDSSRTSGDLTGQSLDDRYFIEGVLGEGSAGVVYSAQHIALKKRVAVKVVRASEFSSERILKRFLREAQSVCRVQHPNVVHVLDFNRSENGLAYFVMEHLEGQTLREALQIHKMLPAQRAVRIARQIAAALDAAHEQGVVHRDLKPDNICLVNNESGGDFIKVIDFGIAKIEGAFANQTGEGHVVGTFRYMSPEQSLGEPVDMRTDVYALGVILYEMLTGQLPFEAKHLADLINQQLRVEPVPPSERSPEAYIPVELEELVLRCIDKQAEKRFPTMQALIAELDRVDERLEQHKGRRAPIVSAVGQVPAEIARKKRRLVRNAKKTVSDRRFVIGFSFATMLFASLLVYVLDGPRNAALGLFNGDENTPSQAQQNAITPTEPPEALRKPLAKSVRIITNPPGAELWSGKELIGNTPISLPMPNDKAEQELMLKMPGFWVKRFTLTARSSSNVTISLSKRR